MIDYETCLPSHMHHLRRDPSGRPVPLFVQDVDGKPDFRIMNTAHMVRCIHHHVCWICGGTLGAHEAFVVGPMCVVNLVSSEPPSHLDCATYSATHCPFLINPDKVRRDANMPDTIPAAGVAILRNPGVSAVIVTKTHTVTRVQQRDNPDATPGVLFGIGTPERVVWYTCGRRADRVEVLAALEQSITSLSDSAREQGPKAVRTLESAIANASLWVPLGD